MTLLKRVFQAIVLIIFLGFITLYATGNGFFITALKRTYLSGNTTANINDYTAFEVHQITSSTSQPLANSQQYNQYKFPPEFIQRLNKFNTAAFLVIKNGEVVNELYMNGYHDHSKTNSFSMTKTVITLLTGIAIEDGFIQSLDQPITDFLPEFNDDPLARKATLANLSLMNSGYEWTEDYYSPFSPTVKLYHGKDVEEFLLGGHFSTEPGTFWEYSSASTQLLAIALRRAISAGGEQVSLSQYLSEKIWQPMGMNADALWHTDSKGMELAFCCINTNARNFAKFGLLILNEGSWNQQQLVPKEFIRKMTQPIGTSYYGYSTWLGLENEPAFYYLQGHLGQDIVIVPEHQMVIVRLGETRDNAELYRETEIPRYINQALTLIN